MLDLRSHPTPDLWVINLPWDKPPLTLNQRMHWAPKGRWTKTIRTTAWALARSAKIPPLERCSVTLIWYPPDRRRRDEDNLFGTLKPLADGLVDAGVVPDDTPRWMAKDCRIGDPSKPPRVELRIERVAP